MGERLRDHLYGELAAEQEEVAEKERIPGIAHEKNGKKWKWYSGLFILFKQKCVVSTQDWHNIFDTAFETLATITRPLVPTHV